jgi:hypothetical protein
MSEASGRLGKPHSLTIRSVFALRLLHGHPCRVAGLDFFVDVVVTGATSLIVPARKALSPYPTTLWITDPETPGLSLFSGSVRHRTTPGSSSGRVEHMHANIGQTGHSNGGAC